MEESCDPVIKVVYMPFFEVKLQEGLSGEIVKSHIYFVYTEFCHITCFCLFCFFILGEICRIFVSMKFYPPYIYI